MAKRCFFISLISCILGLPLYSVSQSMVLMWSFQQPTYLVEVDTLWLTTYNCDTTKDICKVNFDFTPSIPTDEPSTHYACLIDFWFWVTGEESKCNPNTVEFPIGNWTIQVVVKKIADDTIVNQGTISLIHSDGSIGPLRVTYTREWQSPTYLLLKEDTSLAQYTCDPTQPECKINLKITPLLDGAGSSALTCEITSDFDIIPTTDPCNPNTSIVPTGSHDLVVKILDKNKNVILQTATITLNNTPEDTTIDPTKVVTDITWQQPTYFLEKDDTSKTQYTCDPTKSECKINLLVTPKLDGAESPKLSCHITADFGMEENDCNPSDAVVPKGNHALTIEVKNSATGDVISTRVIQIQWWVESTGGGGSFFALDLSQAQIVVQSGLDENFVCKTEICQVNFSADVPTGALCSWDFGSGTFETQETDKKCNPWYVKFPSETSVVLRVTDPNSNASAIKTLHVYRTKAQENTKKLQALIELQTKLSSTKRLVNSGLICALGKSESCSLNFTGASSVGAKTWYWDFWDGVTAEKENPGAHSFKLWKYQVKLMVSDELTTDTAYYDVIVVRDFEPEKCLNCENIRGKIQISAVLPNPPHADTVEWIEIRNISQETLQIDGCRVADDTDSFEFSGVLVWNKTLRLKQSVTGLNLWNSHESLKLLCGEIVIDTFQWDFEVPVSYIIHRDVIYAQPQQALISHVVDGDTVDAMIEWKKIRLRLLGIDTPETVHPRKSIEKFGLEASNFTRMQLEGKTVWLTFDFEPVDHYGRRLAYVWRCDGPFSESSCVLFNAQIVSQWYGRMERRFEFLRYDEFAVLEKSAKQGKLGIWSDVEFAKMMNVLSSDEKDRLTSEQEKEYLELQEELLAECLEEEKECDDKKPVWKDITAKITTLTISPKKSGIVTISGRTWWKFPLKIDIYQGENLVETLEVISDEMGEYELFWTPKTIGWYTVKLTLQKENDTIEKVKSFTVDVISQHFSSSLQSSIIVQGQITDNRWREWDVFHCRSREFCSVNVIAETNREDEVSYLWIFPDGSVSDERNPGALKLPFGQYEMMLITLDEITGEALSSLLKIDHQPIPKKAKTTSKSSKYTLDMKDMPQDIGGGVEIQGDSAGQKFIKNLILLVCMSSILFVFFAKNVNIDK